MGPSFTTWLTYYMFLLINCTNMVSSIGPITPFMSTDEPIDDTAPI